MAMKYSDLVSNVSVMAGLTQEVTDKVLKSLTKVIEDKILTEKKITIPRLMTFEAIDVSEKTGVLNGKEWKKEAHSTIKAYMSDVIKTSVEVKSNPALAKEDK